MRKYSLAALVLFSILPLLLSSIASASEATVFGKTYIRETRKPDIEVDTFGAPDLSATFTLTIINGKNGLTRASSATTKNITGGNVEQYYNGNGKIVSGTIKAGLLPTAP